MDDLSTNQKIGKKIRSLRNEKHLTQFQLADELSIHPKHLSNIENGRKAITITLLDKLCNIFEKPHYYFFDFIDSQINDDDISLINSAVQMLKSADPATRKNLIKTIHIFTNNTN